MKLQEVDFPESVVRYQAAQLDTIRRWGRGRELPAPVQVEIGSNRGRFLLGLAAALPNRTVVGMEIRRKFADALDSKIAAAGLSNAHALGVDANLALPMLFADGALERLYVLFPDPWWKKRHARRRLLTPGFLDLAADKLQPRGHLIIKTDVAPYARYLAELLETTPRFRRISEGDADYPDDEPTWPLTSREFAVRSRAAPIWKFYLVSTGRPRTTEATLLLPRGRFPKPSEAAGEEGTQAQRPRRRG